MYDLLASLFLGVRASGRFARTASIRSHVEESEATLTALQSSQGISAAQYLENLSGLVDMDSDSGLMDIEDIIQEVSQERVQGNSSSRRRQRSLSDVMDSPTESTVRHMEAPSIHYWNPAHGPPKRTDPVHRPPKYATVFFNSYPCGPDVSKLRRL